MNSAHAHTAIRRSATVRPARTTVGAKGRRGGTAYRELQQAAERHPGLSALRLADTCGIRGSDCDKRAWIRSALELGWLTGRMHRLYASTDTAPTGTFPCFCPRPAVSVSPPPTHAPSPVTTPPGEDHADHPRPATAACLEGLLRDAWQGAGALSTAEAARLIQATTQQTDTYRRAALRGFTEDCPHNRGPYLVRDLLALFHGTGRTLVVVPLEGA
jgi:hypothetical protein